MTTINAAQQAIAALSCPERRQRRLDRGLSQIDLARECGVSLNTINKWEKCAGSPSDDNAVRYVMALDLPIGASPMGGDAA